MFIICITHLCAHTIKLKTREREKNIELKLMFMHTFSDSCCTKSKKTTRSGYLFLIIFRSIQYILKYININLLLKRNLLLLLSLYVTAFGHYILLHTHTHEQSNILLLIYIGHFEIVLSLCSHYL